jgi:hypothetical protein
MTGRSVKPGSRLGLSVRTEGGELEIGRHRTDESEELRRAPGVVDSEISRNGMLAAGFGDPVLMVRPHRARPPDALVERSARGDQPSGIRWPGTVNQARAFTAGSASIHCRTLFGDAQSNPRSTAHRAPLYFRAIVSPSGHGRIEDSMLPDPGDVLCIPCRWLLPVLVPAHGHRHSPTCNADTLHRRRLDQLQVPAPSPTDLARCSLSRSVMWLAVFKMMHRSGGRQGYGQLLAAFAAFSSTLRSLTGNGPPRTSPRPFGHP